MPRAGAWRAGPSFPHVPERIRRDERALRPFFHDNPGRQQARRITAGIYYDDVTQVTHPVSGALLGNIVNPWQVQIINNYYLSKRTNLYLTTAYAKNASLNFDTSVGGLGTGYYLGAGKNSMFGAVLGIRQTF
ncbi:hypothetical protein ACKI2N_007685 [Cupriavidus sp. 30B13]|uniref:hypothetical protein n=1 Tax=Cupriavidus sp. 30B13 TaxID=3384241 RepID=UPI003B8F086E